MLSIFFFVYLDSHFSLPLYHAEPAKFMELEINNQKLVAPSSKDICILEKARKSAEGDAQKMK